MSFSTDEQPRDAELAGDTEQQRDAELASLRKKLATTEHELESAKEMIKAYAALVSQMRTHAHFFPLETDDGDVDMSAPSSPGDAPPSGASAPAGASAPPGASASPHTGDTDSGDDDGPPKKRGRKSKSAKIDGELSSLAAEAMIWARDLLRGKFDGTDQLWVYARKARGEMGEMSETDKQQLVGSFDELMKRARQHLNLTRKPRGHPPKGKEWRGTKDAGKWVGQQVPTRASSFVNELPEGARGSAEDAAEALKLARKKQAAGDDAGAMKMAQKSLRICASDEAQKLVDHIRKFGDDSEMAATARRIIEAADLYDVLQLTHDATPDDIKKAYHRTCKVVHPDKNRSRLSDEAFKRVGEAFTTLSDPWQKQVYDNTIHLPPPH